MNPAPPRSNTALIAAGIALAIIEIIYALGTNLVAKLQSLATALK
ncbi:Flp pilus assembly pilin Flp [Bradyrhizobium sp. i1.3.1]